MKILVLQHARIEHPGVFRKFLEEDGHDWIPVHLDEGEKLPELDGFDALWVMGGPMDVWEENKYPWLANEKKFIKEAVEDRGIPFLGLCLGHQLLAEALGGRCGKSRRPEIGVLEVSLTKSGVGTIIFDDFPEKFLCLQWHGAEVRKMPIGAQCLATSTLCGVQAMSWGPRAYSMQFHLEVESNTVENWAEIPSYRAALHEIFGNKGTEVLKKSCMDNISNFNRLAERFYINWLQIAAQVN